MADLILTQEETDALSWLDLDDDALGKVVRNGMIGLANVADEQDQLAMVVAAHVLIGIAIRTNADTLDMGLKGVTHDDVAAGDWSIKVRHKKPSKRPS